MLYGEDRVLTLRCEGTRVRGGRYPLILNFGTTCGWVGGQLYATDALPPPRAPRELGGIQGRSEPSEKGQPFYACREL
jgi:hypothetical protein